MGRKRKNDTIPTYDQLLIPTLKALTELGGSGSIEEINEKVYEVLNLPSEIIEIPHNETSVQSEIDYRLAWARTYLKKYGLIENSSRGIWALIDNDIDISKLSSSEIVKSVKEQVKANSKAKKTNNTDNDETGGVDNDVDDDISWKEELIATLLRIEPTAFERLCQRILRESGFVQVEVTKASGDGGIDGKGIVKINGFLSFHVFFQSKRYQGSVGSGAIRDFRGAMQGRADKGLFITTGNFTRDAMKEATRDGAPPIDLIDGEILCDKLKELKLGVNTELIEEVSINKEWFEKI